MVLALSVLRCPDHAVPETRRLTGGELTIGRDAGRSQWVLPDPSQQISRLHCVVRFDGTGWQVVDRSANGTFLNQEATALGQDKVRTLKDGDRIRVGPYEIEARLEAPSYAAAPPPEPASFDWGGSLFPEHPAPAAGDSDPFAPSGGGGAPFGESSISLPADLLAPDPFAVTPSVPLGTTPDHTPRFTDAMVPPRPLLSDDWAKDFQFEDPFATPAPPAADAFAFEPAPSVQEAPPVASSIVAPVTPTMAPPPIAGPSVAAPPVAVPPVAVPADGGLLAAFLEGAGMADFTPADAAATLREAGAAFRAFVAGLREVLIVRAEVKGAMGIDKTMIRARGNNPLKFAAGDDDALAALFGARRGTMPPAAAVAEALRDIRMHETATLPAMQAAVRALLARLDPEKMRAAAEGGLLPAQKRARAFEYFEAEFNRLTAALGDDFDSVFGRRFAEEYDRIVADLRAGEPPP
ncbi:MAG TPA: type VI secretion system-associated FHA domain protein TagH [Acetobacteraceae bacterium]|nr:type VI secretion system-associated FHA domain protein TagH [Acetobacteraceae bacterium]